MFNIPGSKHLAVIWQSVVDWYSTHRTLIPKEFLGADCYLRLANDPELNTPEVSSALNTSLFMIGMFDASVLDKKDVYDHIISQVQERIDAGVIMPALTAIEDDTDMSAHMANLQATYSTSRISSIELFDLANPPKEARGIKYPTGFAPFDNMMGGGIGPGDVIGVVGPSGGGKTTFSVMIASTFAGTHKKNVLYLPYENPIMPEYWRRFVGSICGFKYARVQELRGPSDFTEEEAKIFEEKYSNGAAKYFTCCDMLGNSDGVDALDSHLGDLEAQGFKVDLVIVDQYMQLLNNWMQAHTKSGSKVEVCSSQMCTNIMNMAGRREVSVLLLHQLTSALKGRSAMVKVKPGETMSDKGFDAWLSGCVGFGVMDTNNRMWMSPMKSRHKSKSKQDYIVELDGDNFRLLDVNDMFTDRGGGKQFYPKKGVDEAMVGQVRRMAGAALAINGRPK